MRLKLAAVAIVLTIAIAPALAQTDAAPSGPPAAQTETPAPAPKEKRIRYVNEKGETLICKAVSGATGTRLKGRGKLICGTQTEWDDSDSEINQLFDNMIQSNTPTFKG